MKMISISKKDMTQEIANRYLQYDPITGILTRRYKYHHNVIEGKRACRPSNNKKMDHLCVVLCGRDYPAHRIIWLMVTGNFPKHHIDHINHNEKDNRWDNLREVTQRENNKNQSKRSDNTTGITGVWISKVNGNKKYIAEIYDLNRKKKTASFYTLEEAAKQRKLWEIEFKYHPNHGLKKD